MNNSVVRRGIFLLFAEWFLYRCSCAFSSPAQQGSSLSLLVPR